MADNGKKELTQKEKEKENKELHARILAQLAFANHQTIKREETNIDIETQFLRQQLLINKILVYQKTCTPQPNFAQGRIEVERIIKFQQQHHQCSNSCHFERLQQGTKFSYNDRIWIAEGVVHVCRQTIHVHLCGIDHCTEQIIMPRGEGICCMFTGTYLGAEYSMARERTDVDIRVTGETARYRLPIDDIPWQGDSIVSQLELASNSPIDAQFIANRYTNQPTHELVKLVKQRVSWRGDAYNMYNNLVMSKQYEADLVKNYVTGEDMFRQRAMQYYRSCAHQGYKADIRSVMLLWHTHTRPTYKNVYLDADINQINKDNAAYFVECMIRIWEQLKNLPYAQANNLQFSGCSRGILNYLATGITTNVYIVPPDYKPYRINDLPANYLSKANKVVIEFIPSHPQLVLASSSSVNKINPPNKQTTRFTGYKKSHMVRRRRAQCVKNGSKTYRKTRHLSRQIPSTKHINYLYNNLINKCTHVNQLYNYCLRNMIAVQVL